jgi:hypothetical protein
MFMRGHDPMASNAQNYLDFASEASGRSPQYEHLATEVAGDAAMLRFLSGLPPEKRQPNLLFAAACFLLGQPAEIGALRGLVARRPDELASIMRSRRTQTNEPARCATLLPALAMLPQPLALIEVGASAGLTLLPDRYSYDYAGHRVNGSDPDGPVIACEPRGPAPLPPRVPTVAWRAGLDLNPLDVADDDDMRWLDCLIWPGEAGRRERLAAAVATARRDPPRIVQGDLLTDLPQLAARAPKDATLVIFHSAVLAYVAPSKRGHFADLVRGLGAVWMSNEGPRVLPGEPGSAHANAAEHGNGCFVLVRDGHTPVAVTDGHGEWFHWLPQD